MSGSEQHANLDKLAQASFDLTPDASYWVRANGKVILVNTAACKQLGYSSEELLQMTIYDIDDVMTREMWAAH